MNANPITQAPSLYTEGTPLRQDHSVAPRSLLDLMHDGFYLLLLLRNRYSPSDAAQFAVQVRRLLDAFERGARQMNVPVDDIYAAKYAYCAAVDETILSSDSPIRDEWERSPLQLILFGDQLAGENFFTELETVRHRGAASVQTLEIFYMCLLCGFQGKYMLESKEKLNYLIATLDKEIAHLKGKRAQFAPNWKAPDKIKNMVRSEIPLWIVFAAFGLFGAAAYATLNWLLVSHTNTTLENYFDIVKLAPKVAHITISLP